MSRLSTRYLFNSLNINLHLWSGSNVSADEGGDIDEETMIMMGSGSITTVRMFRMDNKVLGINAGCHLQPQLSQRSRAQHAESQW